ncbi:MAG: PilZ domain-containing protein [Piscirickettsiaceae bacterium]|nr:MAG: PilZ domain-containing protein [Piscirickettsiaceae bacterium]
MRAYERKYIRIEYRKDVRLRTRSGVELLAHSENISAGGIEIVCDRITAQTIMPVEYQFDPDEPLVLSVELSLDNLGDTLHASCSVQNVRRLAQDSFGFNLKFNTFKQQGAQLLEGFVKEQSNYA